MNMRDYAFTEYGIVLNGLVDSDVLEEMAEDETVEYQFSFTGEAFPIRDDGGMDWGRGDTFEDETVYYIASKCPGLFEAAYPDMKSMVADMVAKYQDAREEDGRLPRLTAKQVREHLRSVQGTYYG